MITYMCAYWLSPEADDARKSELRKYFDLQQYLKKRMGCRQIIFSNIDYPGARELNLPPNFTPKHAFYARYFALKQLVENDAAFPLCVHDHDFFNVKDLPHDESAILVGSLVDGCFSEQAVVYPEIAKQAIIDFTDFLWALDFDCSLHYGYGTEERHEGLYSPEAMMGNLKLKPFRTIPMRIAFNVKDQVSFDILTKHSLDLGSVDGVEIPLGTHAIHGHLNKGEASEVLLNWLAENMN